MKTTNSDLDNIDKIIKAILPYFFVLVFISTAYGAVSGYLDHNSWKMGDWLINYQGGFIRRGLLGEVIYKISVFSQINPGSYVLFSQIFFYSIFFYFSYLLLKNEKYLFNYSFLIFSPFIFTFQVYDVQGGFRKEIIFFAILVFIVWCAKSKDFKKFENIFFITLILYPLAILTHEMLAILLPYLVVVYINTSNNLTKIKLSVVGLMLIPSMASFMASIYYSGTAIQIEEIFNSLLKENYTIKGGAISWLDKDSSFGFSKVRNTLQIKLIGYFLIMMIFSFFAYIPIYAKIQSIIKNKISLLLVMSSIIGSLGLFLVALDWGRFLYIHLASFFILSLVPVVESNKCKSILIKKPKVFLISFFVIYSSFWHIPHCCGPSISYVSEYKKINIIQFSKPYIKAFSFFQKFKEEFK